MTVRESVVVRSQNGLYARPATFFVQKANEHTSAIWVEKEERRANAKSLLGVLSMGITQGMQIKLIADGPDEEEALDDLVALLTGEQAE